jgi:hypothetical protein
MNLPDNCPDYLGRQVIISQSVIEHIEERHPEMVAHWDKLCEVLRSPDFVYYRQRTNSFLFYKLRVLTGKIANNYMLAIVRYDERGEGFLKTSYSTGLPAYREALVYAAGGG